MTIGGQFYYTIYRVKILIINRYMEFNRLKKV
jgi:hypothetical protein